MVSLVFNPRESEFASLAFAAVAVVAAMAVLHLLLKAAQDPSRPRYRKGLWTIVIGSDNRWSTSKVQVAMWTVSVLWALVALIFLIGGDDAAEFEDAFALEGEYLILVGFPATAGLVAKALTMSRVDSGAMDKSTAEAPRLANIVSNDEGAADLGDWQYFLFNLVALAAFYTLFISAPRNGLPSLPETLVALTGASAAIYVGKKGTERQRAPEIRWVRPSSITIAIGQSVEVAGSGFIAANDPKPTPPRSDGDMWWIELGLAELEVVEWSDTFIRARIIAHPSLPAIAAQTDSELIVYDTRGRASSPKVVQIAPTPD